MCYSAMVRQNLKTLSIQFNARIQTDLFEDLYQLRAQGAKVKLPRAMDYNFETDDSQSSLKIKNYLEIYRNETRRKLEEDLFIQAQRLTDAERKLKTKPTKTAEKEKGIAERKIEANHRRLKKLNSEKEDPADSRVYALDYAPVLVVEQGERKIVPMRYLLRPAQFPESFDRDFSGCYNARRDSLKKFWRNQYGHKHAVLVMSSFFENVYKHDFEKRLLRPGEAPENQVIEFKPAGWDSMLVACIWDKWVKPGEPDLYSFALITDEPPKEISQAGHDRCPIFLKEENVARWLEPDKIPEAQREKVLGQILDDKEMPIYLSTAVA